MLKILIVIGTRPEGIKMASVIHALKSTRGIKVEVCITAQHRSMLDQVLQFFHIVADYDLNIMEANQSLNASSGKILLAMDNVLDAGKPDLVMVHGDTNTSFAAALAAFYRKIPIAHVEAGLRSGNMLLPFPEEGNRCLISKIASIHFAPTLENVRNLVDDGIKKNTIIKTGNTVIDSLLFTAKQVTEFSENVNNRQLKNVVNSKSKIILVTGHRRENLGKGLLNICNALKNIARLNPEIFIVYPVHLNPKVLEPVNKILGSQANILLTEPLAYPDFVHLMQKSTILLTDSGGIQEEGPSLGKPVLVMRDVTERPEAISAGTVKRVGTNPQRIEKAIQQLLNSPSKYRAMAKQINPYGDGKAAQRIAKWLKINASKIKQLKQQ